MPQHDPRIDAYIAKSAEFARPILTRLRELVHSACPEAEETLKWSTPTFTYKGKILCEMTGYLKQAMKLVDDGVKAPPTKTAAKKPPVDVPDDLAAALKKNRKAQATFDGFPPSQRREYVEWLTEAKREDTRARRLEQAVEWMAEGKRRHWKYQDC